MPSTRIFQILNWMTGLPDVRTTSASTIELGQRIPWMGIFLGGVVSPLVAILAVRHFFAFSARLVLGFEILGVIMIAFAAVYILWLRKQAAIVIFDRDAGVLTIPRLQLSLDAREIDRFQVVDGTYEYAGRGAFTNARFYAAVALTLTRESTKEETVIYATARIRKFNSAWATFAKIVRSAISSPTLS